MKGKFLFTLAALLALALAVSGAITVRADSGPATYVFLVGTDFLCDLAPDACPNVAMASNGDTIEISGSGTFSIHPDSVSGGGTFTHKDADGNVLGSGTWTATELLSFHSYGSAVVQGLPPEFTGGKVWMRVHLSPAAGGPGFDAILRITCVLGDKIPASAEEGVRLNLLGPINFHQEVSGLTLFIRQ